MKKILLFTIVSFLFAVNTAYTQNITGSGTNNYVLKFTSTGTTAGNSTLLYDNATSVGVGTTNPSTNTLLHTYALGAKTISHSGNLLQNISTSSTASINKSGLEIISTGTWNGASAKNIGLYISSVTGGTNNYDAIFNGGGNIGIGTTSPTAKLEVNGQIKVTGGSPGAGKVFTSDANGLASWQTPTAWQLTGNTGTNPGTNYIGTYDAKDLVFKTNNVEKMRIVSNGTINLSTDVVFNGSGTFGNSGGFPVTIGWDNIGGESGIIDPSEDMIIAGYIDFGSGKRYVYGSSINGSGLIVNPANNYIGIGTTTPGATLHVNGSSGTTLKIVDGNQGSGKILTSDANGVASWTTPVTSGTAWQLTGNAGTNPSTNFIGTTDSIPLIFKSKNKERMQIDANGNVGIGSGLFNFSELLHVIIDTSYAGADAGGKKAARFTYNDNHHLNCDVFVVPFLNDNSYDSLSVLGDQGLFWSDNQGTSGKNSAAGFVIAPYSNKNIGIRITSDGNVGIGTSLDTNNTPNRNPNNYKLAVNGNIGAKEVFVEISSTTWPDYVFDKKYNLLPLKDVESYINTNNHLPNVPSASEIGEKGIAVGEMNSVLLKKVEELTLYLIEQNKIINNQQSEINQFKEKISNLESKIK